MDLKSVLVTFQEKMKAKSIKSWQVVAGSVLVLFVIVLLFSIPKLFDRGIRLIGMTPSGEISPKNNLTFSFSGDIALPNDIGNTFSGDLIQFTPPLSGKYRWISQRELRFLPEVPFRPSTKYKVELQTKLVKAKDRYLSGKRVVEFSTNRFKIDNVTTSFEYSPAPKKGVQLIARLNFNYPVAPVELRKALKLRFSGWGKEIKYDLDKTKPSPSFIVSSEILYLNDKEQKIELSLPSGFRCVDGSMGMEQNYLASAVLGAKKDLTILEAIPKTDNEHCWISVRCSQPVNGKNIADFIQLKPEVPFRTEVDGEYIIIRSDRFASDDDFDLQINKGLPAVNGYPLKREFSISLLFTDLEPSLKFNSNGRYLSSKGYLNLGLETVNIDRVNLEISQIYANNLVAFLHGNNSSYSYYYDDEEGGYYDSSDVLDLGRVVKSTVLTVSKGKNETITTPINLGEYLDPNFRGFFQVKVCDNDYRWRNDYKYVIITDLGLMAKMGDNELMIWANSLDNLTPKAKVKVSLISRNNQTIATQITDNQGIARFKNLKENMADFEPFIVLGELDNDFSFIHLPSSLVPATDFDVQGRPHLEEGYEAFLYMDRDIFRPGDAANLVSVIRKSDATMPPEFPARLQIHQPDGQIFKELQSNTRDRGACEFNFAIPDYAQTGKYNVNLLVADKEIGSTSFSVEDFMPERIKVTTKTDKQDYGAGETAKITVEGVNLFGPPAAGRRTEMRVRLDPQPFTPANFRSYTFGDPEREFTPINDELSEEKLDENGLVDYEYEFPGDLTPPATLKALFEATVIEDGGRAVSSYKVVTFHPYKRYIGIKPMSSGYGEVAKPYPIKYVLVDRQGNAIAKPALNAEVYRITWNSVYRRDSNGRYSYVSNREERSVFSGTINGNGVENTFEYTPQDYGEYQIVLTDSQSDALATVNFYACGWGYSPWAMESPEKIQLDLDRKVYQAGQSAKVQIKAPFAGKALVTVERGKVYSYQIVNLKANTGVVNIPVKEDYEPNVYVSVHLIRSTKSLDKKAPARAFGTVPLMVDCSRHRIDLDLGVVSEIRPNREVEVVIKSNKASAQSYLTLAAVDEGICQITNYNTPDPMEFFYGKRQLAIDSYDLYGMLLPEVSPVQSKASPGGDEEADGIRRQNLNPVSARRVKPVSLWKGLAKFEQGAVRIKLNIPQFNGTLRLMAVANDGANFGSAQKKVIVRDPIVLTPTIPRFIAPGDQFTVPVSVTNGTGKTGDFTLSMKITGPVDCIGEAVQSVNINSQAEKVVYFNLKAQNTIGKVVFSLEVKGNGQTCQVSEELPLRPAMQLTHEILSGTITADKPLILDQKSKWLPGTATYALNLAPFPTLKFAGSLQYLLGYPYGCVEQTTSKVFPLLYFDNLVSAIHDEAFKEGTADYYVSQGIEKLESMQLHDGNFAYWPGGNYSNDWGSIYASHFLIEARKAGFAVSDRVYDPMLDYLERVSKINDKNQYYYLALKVYALYDLSLAGKPQISSMVYLKNYALNNMSDYSKAQLAAAYYYTGDRKSAQEILPESFAVSTISRETGGNFDSQIRSDAIILGVLADIDPLHPAIPKLVERLSKQMEFGYWGTTQENAFALMAIGKVVEKQKQGNYRGEVTVGNTKLASFTNEKPLYLKDSKLGKDQLNVKLTGGGNCYYFFNVSGIPADTYFPEEDSGLTVRRVFMDRYGEPVNHDQIKQGDLIIAEISLTSSEELDNIAIVDMLPAGLEIENPRLKSNASLEWLGESNLVPDYMDIRDDRLLLFTSIDEPGTYYFYYALRAVTCGDFVLPPIKAECMYEPEIYSYSSSGQVKVIRE